jgi:hypothetical protein
MKTILRMTGRQHEQLRRHLFPGDGCEAAAVALCGRRAGKDRHVLTVREIKLIPYEECAVRTPLRVTWSTESLVPLLVKAAATGDAILKIHSHPGGFPKFSETDDEADAELFESVYGWTDGEESAPHASCVMLPSGEMFGRIVKPDGGFEPLSTIAVAGDDLHFWHSDKILQEDVPEFARRHAQAFGAGTFSVLRRLSIAVVGCSGTGSPVVEMLARLGVGRLVIVDPDRVEEKNLNRILNAGLDEARRGEFKVDVLARAVRRMGTGTQIKPIAKNLFTAETVKQVAECDVLFGCMDSVDGRHLLNKLAVFYSIPYFDVGVKLVADGAGGVEQICGTVHYLQPDGSSLLSRRTYTLEQFAAASLKRANPLEYEKRREEKYIAGVQEDRPAVISVNMLLASVAVNELLARLHRFRDDGNEGFAATRISLTQGQTYYEPEGEPCRTFARHTGRGDVLPLLEMSELSETIEDSPLSNPGMQKSGAVVK